MVHYSFIKVRLNCSPPLWFLAYITKAFREAVTFIAVHSKPMTSYSGKDKVTEGDCYVHCMPHRLITFLLWTVDNIHNSNVKEVNKIICQSAFEGFFFFFE